MSESDYNRNHKLRKAEAKKWVPGSNRSHRFSDMPGYKRLIKADIAVYGVGAVGRQVALNLATMGAKNVTLVDPDNIEAPNMGTQGFRESGFGQLKAEQTAIECIERNSKGKFTPVHGMVGLKKRVGEAQWKPEEQPEIVFCCVDDMVTRNEIFRTQYLQPAGCIVDTRMGAFAARVISDVPPFKVWEKTLFADSAAFTGRCTLQSTFFAANVTAGLAVCAAGHWCSSKEGKSTYESQDFILDLMDFDITHQESKGELTRLKQLEGNLAVVNLGIGSAAYVDHGEGWVKQEELRREKAKSKAIAAAAKAK
jgi:sulfur carrier protein ThiS adenylyltransferase